MLLILSTLLVVTSLHATELFTIKPKQGNELIKVVHQKGEESYDKIYFNLHKEDGEIENLNTNSYYSTMTFNAYDDFDQPQVGYKIFQVGTMPVVGNFVYLQLALAENGDESAALLLLLTLPATAVLSVPGAIIGGAVMIPETAITHFSAKSIMQRQIKKAFKKIEKDEELGFTRTVSNRKFRRIKKLLRKMY